MAAIRKAVRAWDPKKIYDISPDERKALEERAKIRAELKAEWVKKSTDPFRGVNGYIFDPAVQRFLAMRQDYWYQFKPTPKNFAFFFGVVILPCFLIYAKITHDTNEREEQFRSGNVSYKDRQWKFI